MTMIEDGAYVILTMKDLSYAVHVNSNADYNGANIQLHKRYGDIGESQLVYVVTHENGFQSIRFPTTGKCFCIAGGALQNENVIHQWVFHENTDGGRYPDGDHRCLWVTELVDGVTATVDGVQYPVYGMRSAKNTNWAIHIFWATAKPSQNLVIYTNPGSFPAQAQFVFIPVNALDTGVYRLESRVNKDVCIGVSESSIGAGSNVYLVGDDDTNAQRWIISNSSNDRYSDTGYKITNAACGKLMRGMATTNGANVELSDILDSKSLWSFNFVEADMEERTNFSVTMQEGFGKVLDAEGGVANGSKIGTNLFIWDNHGGQNQRWTAVMESLLDKTLSAPGDIRFSSKITDTFAKIFSSGSSLNIYPSFQGDLESYQIRYRWRGKKKGSSSYTAWSSWKSIADSSETCSGWGSELAPNTSIVRRYGRTYSTKPIRFTPSVDSYYAAQFEVSIRPWIPKAQNAYILEWPGHGPSATGTYIVGYTPVYSVLHVTFTPKGLAVVFESDMAFTVDNTVTVKTAVVNDKTLAKNKSASKLDGTDTAFIPFDFIPSEDDPIVLTSFMKTADGIESAVDVYSGTISYDQGQSATISPVVSVTEIGMAYISLPNVSDGDTVTTYVQYGSSDIFDSYAFDASAAENSIPIRFGEPYSIWVLWESSDGVSWDIWHESYPALEDPHAYMFVFEDADGLKHTFAIKVNAGSYPRFTRTFNPGADSYNTYGDRYETVSLNGSIPESISITGVLMPILEEEHSTVELAEMALTAGYAYFRSPKEDTIYRVAITSLSLDYSDPRFVSATLNAKRIG